MALWFHFLGKVRFQSDDCGVPTSPSIMSYEEDEFDVDVSEITSELCDRFLVKYASMIQHLFEHYTFTQITTRIDQRMEEIEEERRELQFLNSAEFREVMTKAGIPSCTKIEYDGHVFCLYGSGRPKNQGLKIVDGSPLTIERVVIETPATRVATKTRYEVGRVLFNAYRDRGSI